MDILPIILFGISSNADSFVLGLSYGIRKKKISLFENLVLGLISLFGTVLSMILGKYIVEFISLNLASVFGSVIMMIMGGVCLIDCLSDKVDKYECKENVCRMRLKELLVIGFALTLNNATLGIGVSMVGLPIVFTSLCSFVCCLVMLYVGNRTGRVKLSERLKKIANPASGVLMILMGIYELIF